MGIPQPPYCHGYWAGYRVGWNEELDVDANGPCFPGMQQLILAKCISGVLIAVGFGVTGVEFAGNVMAGGDLCPDPGHCTCTSGVFRMWRDR